MQVQQHLLTLFYLSSRDIECWPHCAPCVNALNFKTAREQNIVLPVRRYFSPLPRKLLPNNYQVDCHETSKDNPALSQQAAIGVRQIQWTKVTGSIFQAQIINVSCVPWHILGNWWSCERNVYHRCCPMSINTKLINSVVLILLDRYELKELSPMADPHRHPYVNIVAYFKNLWWQIKAVILISEKSLPFSLNIGVLFQIFLLWSENSAIASGSTNGAITFWSANAEKLTFFWNGIY